MEISNIFDCEFEDPRNNFINIDLKASEALINNLSKIND